MAKYTQIGGDVGDPISYGGIWSDGERVFAMPYGREDIPKGPLEVYTFYLSDVPTSEDAWVRWHDVLATYGINDRMPFFDVDKIDALWRAEMVAGYHGWEELDHYPDRMKVSEIKERFMSED